LHVGIAYCAGRDRCMYAPFEFHEHTAIKHWDAAWSLSSCTSSHKVSAYLGSHVLVNFLAWQWQRYEYSLDILELGPLYRMALDASPSRAARPYEVLPLDGDCECLLELRSIAKFECHFKPHEEWRVHEGLRTRSDASGGAANVLALEARLQARLCQTVEQCRPTPFKHQMARVDLHVPRQYMEHSCDPAQSGGSELHTPYLQRWRRMACGYFAAVPYLDAATPFAPAFTSRPTMADAIPACATVKRATQPPTSCGRGASSDDQGHEGRCGASCVTGDKRTQRTAKERHAISCQRLIGACVKSGDLLSGDCERTRGDGAGWPTRSAGGRGAVPRHTGTYAAQTRLVNTMRGTKIMWISWFHGSEWKEA